MKEFVLWAAYNPQWVGFFVGLPVWILVVFGGVRLYRAIKEAR